MEFAIMYQMEARHGVSIPTIVASKAEQSVESNVIMPRTKKIVEDIIVPAASVASVVPVVVPAVLPAVLPVTVKRGRKPKIGAIHIAPSIIKNEESKESVETIESATSVENVESATSATSATKPQKRKPTKKVNENETIPKGSTRRKKPTEPYSSIIQQNQQEQQESVKENTIPTHIEHTMEEINSDDYEIEYVKLTLQEIGSTIYFRDNKKNKLYKRIKDKHVGEYIGRYHPNTGAIHTDIPDSDEEE
jgi:hypothetical protein